VSSATREPPSSTGVSTLVIPSGPRRTGSAAARVEKGLTQRG